MSIKLRALMGVSALAALAMAGAANAGDIWGGGSTLIAPYHDQIACAYGQPLAGKVDDPDFWIPPATFSPVTPPINTGCSHITSNAVHYALTGSGGAINGIFSHDRARYNVTATNWPTGDVQYGLSETAMLASDVTLFNNGGTTPAGIVLSATPTAGQYPIPKTQYGALVQFPVAIAPVALAYDPTYKKVNNAGTVTSYAFHLEPTFVRTYGGLHLDQATYCKIVNGTITNWNDPAITALNNGASLKDPSDPDPFNVPIELVGRFESSGTTTVTTRHFAAACGTTGNAFTAVAGTSTLPAAVQGPQVGGTPVAGKFTRATGSGGVAAYVDFTDTPTTGQTIVRGRLGYVGADYTLPYASNNGLPYTLFTADLKNAAGSYREPNSNNATQAFSGNRPPQTATGASGNYDTTQTLWGVRTSPDDWVRVSATGSSATLANPTPAQAYPIIATVNFLGYTCYATAAKTNAIRTSAVSGSSAGYVNYWFTRDDILAAAGLAAVPAAWKGAITNTFLTPVAGTTQPLNLFFDTIGSTGPTDPDNSTCASLPGA